MKEKMRRLATKSFICFEWHRIGRLLPAWLVGFVFMYWVIKACEGPTSWRGRLVLGTSIDGRCMFYVASVYMGIFLCGDISRHLIGKQLSVGYSRKQIFWVKLLHFYLVSAFWALLFPTVLLLTGEKDWEEIGSLWGCSVIGKLVLYELALTAAVVGICFMAAVYSDGNLATLAIPVAMLILWPVLREMLHYPEADGWGTYLCTDRLPWHGRRVDAILGGISVVTSWLAYQKFQKKNFK